MRYLGLLALLVVGTPAWALPPPCNGGRVFDDRNGNGRMDAGEPGLPGIAVSDGRRLGRTDVAGRYSLPVQSGRTSFVIKPAGWAFGARDDGLPDFWRHLSTRPGPELRYGGIAPGFPACRDFALRAEKRRAGPFEALVFGDPQPKSSADVGHYARGIVDEVIARRLAGEMPSPALGLTLGDVVDDDLSLYPAMNRETTRIGVPWLHVAGNHDLDLDATSDAESLLTFRDTFGPDTFAWEEHEANFVLLDNVVFQPGAQPGYVGGLRPDQFEFLEAYLPTLPRDRLLVVAAHIPFFEPVPGRESFRAADRERLFALLKGFPHLLLLTAHGHVQRHHWHDVASGWRGGAPLHEYNLGAACGSFWSGVADAGGVPDAMMADGTPKGWARLQVDAGGEYALHWAVADDRTDPGIGLHSPGVVRRGAHPAFGVYANVYMAQPDARVEYRVDGGDWRDMQRVARPDPRLMAENRRDDEARSLRGFDRAPEAMPSSHLWRGALPTDLAVGEHRIEVRTRDRWRGELSATTRYRLEEAAE